MSQIKSRTKRLTLATKHQHNHTIDLSGQTDAQLLQSTVNCRVDRKESHCFVGIAQVHSPAQDSGLTKGKDSTVRTSKLGSCELPRHRASEVHHHARHTTNCLPSHGYESTPLLHSSESHPYDTSEGSAAAVQDGSSSGGWPVSFEIRTSGGGGRCQWSQDLSDVQASAAARPSAPFCAPPHLLGASGAALSGAPSAAAAPSQPLADDPFHGDWPHW
jgi:hypothetical protein